MKTREEVDLEDLFFETIRATIGLAILGAIPSGLIFGVLSYFDFHFSGLTVWLFFSGALSVVIWIWFFAIVFEEFREREEYKKMLKKHDEQQELDAFIKFCKDPQKRLR